MVGLAFFADAVRDALHATGQKRKSRKFFEQMLEHHPQLQKEKPEIVAKYWASLNHFAPYMAQEPMAAGAYIRQSIQRGYQEEFGGPPPDTFSTLTDINKKLSDQKKKGPSELVQYALKGSGLIN
jgi:hypothetical protein